MLLLQATMKHLIFITSQHCDKPTVEFCYMYIIMQNLMSQQTFNKLLTFLKGSYFLHALCKNSSFKTETRLSSPKYTIKR